MVEQEKLNILISNFKELEENRKEYIRELIQKLAEIHCNRRFSEEYYVEV
jgi:hypothetical protein